MIKTPICCNIGCSKPCALSRTSISGIKRYRPYCSNCHNATRGKTTYSAGVTPIKKNYCENKDGRFGFKCHASGKKMPSLMLDLDHIDGNHYNNKPKNFQTLCKCCHAFKTNMFGDGSKPYKYGNKI